MTSARPPVILLPGAFGQELLYWNVWQFYLEKEGYHVYPASFPRLTFSDLRLCARLLAEKVEEVCAVEDTQKVALVGHSMGGLIARYYVNVLGGHERVSHLACLGVPHHGTWTAATAPVLTATRQILPGSAFLTELNDPQNDHRGVPVLNLWTRWDGIVIPSESAYLDLPGVDNRVIPFVGHWGMLVSRRALKMVGDALQT